MGKRADKVIAELDKVFRKSGGARIYKIQFTGSIGCPDLLLRWQNGDMSFVEIKTTDRQSEAQKKVERDFASKVLREGDSIPCFLAVLPRYRRDVMT